MGSEAQLQTLEGKFRYGLGRAIYTALLGTFFSAGLTLRRLIFPT